MSRGDLLPGLNRYCNFIYIRTELSGKTYDLFEPVDSFHLIQSESFSGFRRLTHSTVFHSVDVVVGHQEAEVEGEVDQGPEDRLANNKYKAPDVIGDVVDVFQGA